MARGLPLWGFGGETSALAETVLALREVVGSRSFANRARHNGRFGDYRLEASDEFRQGKRRILPALSDEDCQVSGPVVEPYLCVENGSPNDGFCHAKAASRPWRKR